MKLEWANGFEPERYELDRPNGGRWTLPRRDFIKRLGGGIVVLLFVDHVAGQQARHRGGRRAFGSTRPRELSAWIHLNAEGKVTVFTGKVEIGQNIRTSLTQAVSEELHSPIGQIQMVMGDTDLVPPDAGTFGSRSTPDMGLQLRKVAATARELLIDLAAKQWKCDPATLRAKDGKICQADGKNSVDYGALAQGKNLMAEVNEDIPLRPATKWEIAGKSAPKVDAADLVTGRHRYASDQSLPGTLHGKILRPPSFGAKLRSVDTSAAEKMAGARVLHEGDFVGVAASDPLAAERALQAIRAEWSEVPGIGNHRLFSELKTSAGGDAALLANTIDRDAKDGSVKLAAAFTVQYIAHCPLEPRAALANWEGGKLTVWTGTQRPFGVRAELMEAFDLPESKVRVIVPDTGSGYGGKHTGEAAIEAARLARAAGKPVKVVWTREEEFTWAYFRPAGVIEIRAAANSDGTLTSWECDNYNSGASGLETLYAVSNPRERFHSSKSPLRQGSYRALAGTANHFARESAMDELASALRMDPYEFRLKNSTDPRLRAVLQAAANAFGWKRKVKASRAANQGNNGARRGCGIAAGGEKGSYIATCAEIEVENSKPRVLKVVQAFDCGAVVNPDHLKCQNEGAIVMGIGGALREQILFDNGRIKNPRFSQYQVPRFSDCPEIEIVMVNRPNLPSAGAGEAPIMGIAPAIANAIHAATGERKRSMPFGMV